MAALFLATWLFPAFLAAQYQVTGVVTDQADGSPLIGANVLEKGTINGTITDFDGNYVLDVTSPEAVLVFSYVG